MYKFQFLISKFQREKEIKKQNKKLKLDLKINNNNVKKSHTQI